MLNSKFLKLDSLLADDNQVTRNQRYAPLSDDDWARDFLENGYVTDQVTKLRPAPTRVLSQNQEVVSNHVPLVGPPVAHNSGHYSSDESGSTGRRSPSTSSAVLCSAASDSREISRTESQDQRLLDLQRRTNYDIVQRNGQRIYGPPPDWTREPPKGSEIFVGRVPRDCFEDELVPVFETVGKIYELRLMMDFSGSNRGFFFVRYTCKEHAKRAVAELDDFELRPGKRIGVLLSVDNRKLWVSGIPNNITASEIKAEMQQLTYGVIDVILYRSQTDKSKTRKYAFVEYESHRAAALARRRLVPTKVCLKGQEIEKVDWAEPEDEVDDEVMSTVRVLFVRNLAESITEEFLRSRFNEWSGHSVERVKKAKDYAFVHFATRQTAEMAKMRAAGEVFDGELLEVEWSKPVDKNIYNTRKQLTKVLSTPVSPCMPQFCGGPATAGMMMNKPCMGGAPGTPPPKNLLRRLAGNVGQLGNQQLLQQQLPPPCGFAENSLFQPVDDPIMKAVYELRLSQSQAPFYGGQPFDMGPGIMDGVGGAFGPVFPGMGYAGYPPPYSTYVFPYGNPFAPTIGAPRISPVESLNVASDSSQSPDMERGRATAY